MGAEHRKVGNLDLKHPRHDVQKPSGSGGALVVHLKVDHRAVFNLQDLDVLSADIDDGVNLGKKEVRTPRMAGKLAHLGLCLFERIAAVAGSEDIIHLLQLHAGRLDNGPDNPLGAAGPGADIGQRLADDLFPILQHNAFGSG